MPLSNLNQEQFASATAKAGHNLIIASAGTGKTSTIVGRIANLLNSGIEPNKLLLLTFTNKASAEMIERISRYFSKEIASKIVSGTFHSVSYKLLKEYNQNITLKQPRELKTLFKSLYEKRVFYNQNSTKSYDGGYLYDLYSLYLNANKGENFEYWVETRYPEHKIYALIYQDVIDEFNDLKQKYGYASFDDLLIYMLKLQKEIDFDFEEILVDEYQDTNPLQGRILDGFQPKSLFCVGDYDQSIYAFNGADINIISTFKDRYYDAKVFTLRKNYRSTFAILDLANRVILNNPRIYEKDLEVVRKDKPIAPKLLGFSELFEQYEYIAKNISNTVLDQKIKYNDIAIIFRNNSTADGIEANLREFNIPSKRKGGTSFFDSKEIKALLDIMTILHNPKDMMAFIHIFEYAKGVGNAIAKELFDGLIRLSGNKQNIIDGLFYPIDIVSPFEKPKHNVQLGLFDDCMEFGSITKFKHLNFEERFLSNNILKHPKLHIDGASFLYDLYNLIKKTRQIKIPYKLLLIILQSNLFQKIVNILSTKRATLKDGSLNIALKDESKEKIYNKAKLLQNLAYHYKDIEKFLNAMILGSTELSQGDGVNLLTIHASKGLEFKKVFIIDLMEGRFPNKKLMSSGGSLEEERRLFYVAVTRAKDELILSYAKYDKIKKIDFIPSRFLKEANML